MEIPYSAKVRPDTGFSNGQLATWLFLASEAMLFGGLFSSYVILRAGAEYWPTGTLNVWTASVNTAVLMVSSVTMSRASTSLKQGRWAVHRQFFIASAILAVVFLGIKSFEYAEHLSRGEYPSVNNALAVYYTLTGLHALHIFGGLIVMLYLLGPGARLHGTNPSLFANRVANTGLYWHFVDVVWLSVFVMLYLV